MNELTERHKEAAYRFRPTGGFDPGTKRFVCPETGMAITDATCRESRKAAPEICVNCLIPLAGEPCRKCGGRIPEQEARAGFETCEFCG